MVIIEEINEDTSKESIANAKEKGISLLFIIQPKNVRYIFQKVCNCNFSSSNNRIRTNQKTN